MRLVRLTFLFALLFFVSGESHAALRMPNFALLWKKTCYDVAKYSWIFKADERSIRFAVKELKTIIENKKASLEARFGAIDDLYELSKRNRFAEKTLLGLSVAEPKLEFALFSRWIVTKGLPREKIPDDTRLYFRLRFLEALVGASAGYLDPRELKALARGFAEIKNEQMVYQDPVNFPGLLSDTGKEIIERLANLITENPHAAPALQEMVERATSFSLVNGREHGSGRAFWLALNRRVKETLPDVERFKASTEVNSSDWNGIEATLKHGLQNWRMPIADIEFGDRKPLELENSLEVYFSRDRKDGITLVLLLPVAIPEQSKALVGHKFVVHNDEGHARVYVTCELGALNIPEAEIPKQGWISFEPNDP